MSLNPVKTRLALLLALVTWPHPATAAEPARTDAFGDPLPAEAIRRIGSLRFRPGGPVGFLLPCPDGKTLLSNSEGDDRRVCVWEMATGRLLRRLPGSGRRLPIALSPKGTVLVTTENAILHLWDFASGRELHRLKGHRSGNFSVAFSPDGKVLAASGFDGVRLWDVTTGAEVALLPQKPPGYRSTLPLAFTPDGKTLIAGPTDDARVHVWDVASRRIVRELTPTDGMPPRSLALSPDGTRLAAGSSLRKLTSDGTIPLWDVTTGKVVRRLRCDPSKAVVKVAFSPDGKLLASVHTEFGKISTVRLWDLATGKPQCSFKAYVSGMAFARDGKSLFTGEFVIRRWDVTTGKEVGAQDANPYSIRSIDLSPDGKLLASVTFAEVRLSEAATGRTHYRFAPPGESLVACAMAPDGKAVATATLQGVSRLWNIADPRKARLIRESIVGKPNRIFSGLGQKGVNLRAVALDGKALATASADGTIRLTDARTGVERWHVKQREPFLDSLVFTAEGRRLFAATRTRDGPFVRAWDVARGEELRPLTAPLNLRLTAGGTTGINLYTHVARLALSHDGGRMLAINRLKTILVWETASGKERLRLDGHAALVQDVAFSPDGRVFASAARGETIRLWDLASGAELAQLRGHRGNVNALVFSPDGKLLYSAGDDTTVLVWDVGRALRRGLPSVPRRDAQASWDDLAAADAGRAYRAMHALRADPAAALTLFRKQLTPAAPVDGKRLAQWLRELDATQFNVRDKAARELARWGEQAEPALRRALADKPSLEVRRRLDGLLEKLVVPSGERLRRVRALEVLEAIGSAEARRVLQALANGAPEARLTREVNESLARLAKRPGHRP